MALKTKIDAILELYNFPLKQLLKQAQDVTKDNFNDEVEFCSIISAKTGKCSQNCKYCAQSSHYRTEIETHPLVSLDEVRKCALSAKKSGASRFSIVTSGKSPDEEDFEELIRMIEAINNIEGLSACASIGILNEKQIQALKNAGLTRYHHNLNACRSYYPEVCTTHSYEERLETIKLAKKYNIEVCSGGIIGMGETRKQRAELIMELLELQPVSVPVNFLHPIEGTPFEVHKDAVDEEEILKTLMLFRIFMPKTVIRYAGGRSLRLSLKNQELGIKAGINGVLIGNYLTTIGISPEEDNKLIERAGKKLKK
ncbi:MAG TPA: biotin synthase BioB [Candidatus Gastranaerophilales bacterium]|nr:biotin synthase BioB [Candidatus Gastranaerophilales bacterium]